MKTLASAIFLLLLVGCESSPPVPPPARPQNVRTLEEAQLRQTTPPETLEFRTEEIIPTDDSDNASSSKPVEVTAAELNLPFAPAIAMDPVDGQKVSITKDTPIAEYKDRIYYFNSAANKRAFMKNAEDYLSGKLATY